MAPHVLVVDDEELIRWSLMEHLQKKGFRVSEAENGAVALGLIAQDPPDCLLLDLTMPEVDGLEVLRRLKERQTSLPILVLTADGKVDTAVEATRLGALRYLTKPFELDDVDQAVTEAIAARAVVPGSVATDRRGDFIGGAPSLRPVYDTLDRLSHVDAPTVLLLGESGTGKDVLARQIHAQGPRHKGPFLDIDCASLPASLIESELFGHERGAFTDARERKRGLLEMSAGGTLFLDEIGEMPLALQAKLLRAIESRTFRRIGGVQALTLDAAIIAATNRDLSKEVAEGRFREDLYFRLNVVPIRLPPLRERRPDIPALVHHLLHQLTDRLDREIEGVEQEAMAMLTDWNWPGNVRELRNIVERAAIFCTESVIRTEHLPAEIRYADHKASAVTDACPFVLPEEGVDLEAVDRGLLLQALERTGGNQSQAARLLGISRYALRYRMDKYDLKDE